MTERMQYDIGLDSKRFGDLIAQGASEEIITEQVIYTEMQLKTDIGERLDRAESHYVYEIRDGALYGQGIDEPFADVIERGIIQRWDGSRENSELTGFRFIESFMTDEDTPDGAIVFNPSPPDGQNYQKNYLDVYKKVGNEVHTVRYFSDLTNEEYRQKILQINPNYQGIIPQNPTDTDFFLSPVIVPDYLKFNPDQLAEFILGKKKGMDEEEFERIWENPEIISLRLSIINTLVENPEAFLELEKSQRALYAGVKRISDGEDVPLFGNLMMKINYLSEQKETLGAGGCGSGACSTSISSALESLGPKDEMGSLNFSCPSCGTENTRPYGGYVYKCKNKNCKDPEAVLPSGLRKNQLGGKLN